ncbi:ankyrin repeat domain-containing protein [Nocardioides marmorisolisilvae]|uniref:Ankyrin repeat domain-containing protein n=1 Tax=Nocardioides marmorisolisilvae TaxID=1542737 RepID=A0A3N0DTC3_9ACTN|nr:ankyrin repeat domain-containing protein [Nocardioides marmorisolisilvae]RNL78862.1 ankyrin repeat domain-containing protein [Nocardioides marmorisolisilvae]
MRTALAAVALVLVAGCSTGEDAAAKNTPNGGRPPTPTATQTAEPSPTVSAASARRLGLRAVAALKRDQPRVALRLIAAGADVNVQDGIKDSVFLYAGAEGYAAVVEAALAHGADVRSTNRYGGTALIPASEHAHVEVIRILIRAGVPIDHVNDLGWTALGEAVGLGNGDARHQEAVRLLLAAGADPSVRDRFGRSVLENAERLGQTAVARLVRAALARQ